jgi:hypothetical protein
MQIIHLRTYFVKFIFLLWFICYIVFYCLHMFLIGYVCFLIVIYLFLLVWLIAYAIFSCCLFGSIILCLFIAYLTLFLFFFKFGFLLSFIPVAFFLSPTTVAARPKAWTVFGRWGRGFELWSRYGCLCVFILCIGRETLRWADPPSYRLCIRYVTEKRAKPDRGL